MLDHENSDNITNFPTGLDNRGVPSPPPGSSGHGATEIRGKWIKAVNPQIRETEQVRKNEKEQKSGATGWSYGV
jgi:hypothetical protein